MANKLSIFNISVHIIVLNLLFINMYEQTYFLAILKTKYIYLNSKVNY